MPLLTSSALSVWQRCPRQYHYRYAVGLTPIGESPRALAFGTATHAGLEAWWNAYRDGAAQYALSAARHAAEESYTSDDPHARAMLSALIVAYDARWSEWARTVEVLAVECPFETELRHPVTGEAHPVFRLAGKIDAMVRLSDGRVALVEHKTSSQDVTAGSDYRRALTLNAQVGIYFSGARALGISADVCVYDMLRKPSLEPLLATPEDKRLYTQPKSRACKGCKAYHAAKKGAVAPPHTEDGVVCVDGRIVTDPGGKLYAAQRDRDESPTEYEARLCEGIIAEPDKYLLHAEIVRSDSELADLAWDLWQTAETIARAMDTVRQCRDVRAMVRHPSACLTHGTPCAYLPVCEGTASARDATRYQRLDNPHVELASAANEGRE